MNPLTSAWLLVTGFGLTVRRMARAGLPLCLGVIPERMTAWRGSASVWGCGAGFRKGGRRGSLLTAAYEPPNSNGLY